MTTTRLGRSEQMTNNLYVDIDFKDYDQWCRITNMIFKLNIADDYDMDLFFIPMEKALEIV
jgi:hypothetical protein